MALSILVTLGPAVRGRRLDPVTLGLIGGGVLVGGGVGVVAARRVSMTAMPQLVAAFHSLVGMAACLVAVGAIYSPEAFGIDHPAGGVLRISLIELSLGVAIGAMTFTGSVIAFAKLNGNMSGAPIMLPGRHFLNVAIAFALVILVGVLVGSRGDALWAFWAVFGLALLLGITLIIPIGGADMPSWSRSEHYRRAARARFTLHNISLIITGALSIVRRHPQLHHVKGITLAPFGHLAASVRDRRGRAPVGPGR